MGTTLKRLFPGRAFLGCAFLGCALLGCAVLAGATLAGCGTATTATTAGTPAGTAAAASRTPQQQAVADAAAMLAEFVPPPGATRLSSAPAGSGGILRHKAFYPGIGNQVDDASFWRVPASAGSALAFEKAHLPRQFALSGSGGAGTDGASFEWWDRPGVPGVIALRELTMEVTGSGSSVTYVRVDSDVAWIPVRPASEKVPAGVTAVTITASPDMNHPKETPAPVTVTDPAKVRQIVAELDGLYLDTSGVHGCLAESGQGITLAFRARTGGPVLATAAVPIPTCGSVRLVIGGVRQASLADQGTFTSRVLAIAGVHWPSWYL